VAFKQTYTKRILTAAMGIMNKNIGLINTAYPVKL